ncbi:MAG: hypothetical protein IJD04_08315, partial [Desulfovibrionaceae bacterium]|nr:hypothetical protein [Desulfovibrionaceae bacterium]
MENNKSELIKNLLEQARDFDCLRENLGNMRELLLILQGNQDLMRPRTCWIVAWPEKRIVFLEELLSAAQTQDEADMVQAVLKVCERGAYKHLDENRELLVTLVREAPHLLNPKQCQVLYWLKRMDGFLQDLIRYLEIPNPFDGVPLDYPPFYGVYPRPWPEAIPQVCGNGKTAGLPERRDAYYEIRKQLTGCLLSRIERVCRRSLRGSSGFCRCPEENNNLMRCFKGQNHPLIAFLSAISRRHQIFFHNFYNAVKNLLSNDPEHPEIRQYERTFSMWPGEDYSEELMRFTADEGEDENSATLRHILLVCEAGGAAGGLLERMDENRRFLETLCVNSDVLELFPWAAGWIQEFDLFFSNLLQALAGELRTSEYKPRPWTGEDYSYALIDFDTRRQNEN